MSNITLARSWTFGLRNSSTHRRGSQHRCALVGGRWVAPLCKVAIVVLAMAGSSCGLATADSGCADASVAYDPMSGEACNLADGSSRGIEDQILALVNSARQNAGSRPLNVSCELANAARDHNARMASDGFFDHRGDGERCLLDRVTFAGTSADTVGENLFKASQGPSYAVARQCVAMWMQSEGHRRNLLSPDFDTTGVSVLYSKGECYITEDFARIGTAMRVTRRSSARRNHAAARHSRTRRSFRVAAARHRTTARRWRTSGIARNDKSAFPL